MNINLFNFMELEWRDVKGFEGLYAVSNSGAIWSYRTGTVLLDRIDTCGYPVVKLTKRGMPYSRRVHRLVAEAFIDNTANKPWVHHKDEDKTNNKVTNLEWVTASENQISRYKDYDLIGSKIWELKSAGYNHRQIVEILGVHRRKVQRVVNGR